MPFKLYALNTNSILTAMYFFQLNFPLIHRLLECGGDPSIGFTKEKHETVLHIMLESKGMTRRKDLFELYPSDVSYIQSRFLSQLL